MRRLQIIELAMCQANDVDSALTCRQVHLPGDTLAFWPGMARRRGLQSAEIGHHRIFDARSGNTPSAKGMAVAYESTYVRLVNQRHEDDADERRLAASCSDCPRRLAWTRDWRR
jgi:hypothetical protein